MLLQGAVLEIGDDLQVQFFGPAQIDGEFDETEAGRYALSFVPPKAGKYEVHISLQTCHVPGAVSDYCCALTHPQKVLSR